MNQQQVMAARVLGPLAELLKPKRFASRAEWCAANIRLPTSSSATPGRYDLDRYAYVRGVLDAADDPEVEQIVMMWATQLGKTTLLQAILASMAALAPVPAMLGAADKDSMIELRDKFYSMAENCEVLAGRVPDTRLRNDRWIDVGSVRCHLAYAYNTQRLSGKSCALVLCTELDRWRKTTTHGDPAKTIAQRVKAFHRSLIVYESTPSNDNSRINRLYQLSDRRRFLVPCPKCNHWQELRFFTHSKGDYAGYGGVGGMKDKKGNWKKAQAAREEAFYLCEKGCKIINVQKPGMVSAGIWIPAGQDVEGSGKITGTPLRNKRIWGCRLSSLYAETVSFGKIAAEFIDSRDNQDDLQVFHNDWLARVFSSRAKVPRWRDLGMRLKGAYQPGFAPPWALFLTAGVDVGESYCRWVVRAWGEGGTSALVDWGTTHKTAASKVSHLDGLRAALFDRTFPLPEGAATVHGHTSLGIRLVGIDVGYKPHLVHSFVRRQKDMVGRIYQIVGRQDIKSGELYRMSVVERSAKTGKVYEGGQSRWELNRHILNSDLFARWKQPLDEAGAWWLTNAALSHCEQYLRELTNEAPQTAFNKLGRKVIQWTVIDQSSGNHYWDCEAYALAMAQMVVGQDWTDVAKRYAQPKRHGGEQRTYAARDNQGFSAR